MSVIKILEGLPAELYHDIESLVNKEAAAYHKLAPELQAALKNGSGILAEINNDLTGPAGPILAAIEAKFGINEEAVTKVLQGLAAAFNLAVADTAPELVPTLQNYLKSLEPSIWADISNAAADIAATVLNGGTPIVIGMNVIKYVYLDIVKPLFVK